MTSSHEQNFLPQPTICPLARDTDGNAIDLPAGAAAWRVRRKTGGRPRIVLGVDKQPVQLPLSYSIVDLEDILAPAEYLLDVVDPKGVALGVSVDVSVGQLIRNEAPGDEHGDEPAVVATALPTTGSETRLVLEANLRATQMAFLHNQKTLELGLRMAETLRDGVRVMAESQADWIKSISSAKGFFRNAPSMKALPAPQLDDDGDGGEAEEDREDEEDDDEQPEPEHWVDKLMPHVLPAIQIGIPLIVAKMRNALDGLGAASSNGSAGKPKVKLEWADLFDWRRAAARRNAAEAEAAAASTARASTPPELDLEAAAHFMKIQQALTPEEAHRAREIGSHFTPAELHEWLALLKPLGVDEAAARIRTYLAQTTAA
jgi:hypothetical protein